MSDYQCNYCGKIETGFGWPSPRICAECAPKIKACPFCGTWGAVYQVHDEAASEFYIECAVCHARGPREPLAELATSYWNRRQDQREPDAVYVNGQFLHRKRDVAANH